MEKSSEKETPLTFDATGRMVRPEKKGSQQDNNTPPLPQNKPETIRRANDNIVKNETPHVSILKGVDDEEIQKEVIEHEDTILYMYKDSASDGGFVTVGAGFKINNTEEAKKTTL